MKIGLGLPIEDPGVLLDWARRAEEGPFTTLGLLDRLVYDNPDPLTTLALLAGATSRVRLQTEVLLAPLYNTAVLAKQTATLDRLSDGRLTLGIGVGGRADDCSAAGIDFRHRGRRLDEQMAALRRVWAGEPYGDGAGPIGPAPATPGGPEVIFGGFAPAALARVARWGDGYLGAGLPPEPMAELFREVERGWRAAERTGRPRLVAQANVALGPEPLLAGARENLLAYYDFSGRADHMAGGLITTSARLRETVRRFTEIGADEVMLYCWAADPDQVDRIAAALD
ncbi:LLM class flavin-dependent oxidoreductase [Streptomyces sp. LP05-1]|uniref:LLM class flavin-dependent oxidoreductase n=1 Tax=Streptomyces pyxinae TaxID=2970734 RepID=A0ABT2CMH5_9ACTN|nr:LLM class flavin-dependent oxidoreductase [Streptomyces sp. LP05-1]MCS0638638.1 LLM class flavin-dependent oxidoreductase [Streptomyces sp. LP05-1]